MSSVKIALISMILGILLLAGGVSGATNVSSCQAITTQGVYVLNTDLSNSSTCITIESSDVVFDGAGYSITGPGSSNYGIYVYKAATTLTNVTVKNAVVTGWNRGIYYRGAENGSILNNNVSNNYYGIHFYYSDSNTLTDNIANSNSNRGIYFYYSDSNTLTDNIANSNSQYGIYFYYSDSNTLSGNTMAGNNWNFRVYGSQDSHYDQNIDTTNTVNGKPVYYIKGASGTTYDSSTNAGWFACISCDNVTVRDLTLKNNYPGLLFWNTSNSNIRNVTVKDSGDGIYIRNSNDITVANNTLEDNSNYGVYFYNVDPSSISGNYINGSSDGIYIDASTDITVDANTIVNSSNSQIYAYSSSNVDVTNNNLYGWTGTTSYGVYYDSVNPGVISGNYITHSSYGVRTYSGAGIAIDTNTIVNSSSYSVYSSSTSNVNATNNNLYGWTGTTTTTSRGVYYDSVNSGVISGNYITMSSRGVYSRYGAGIAIDTNTIVNSSSYSVYSSSTSNVNATNNNLYGWTGTTTTTSSGVYYNSVNPGVISGNYILHSDSGVNMYSGANITVDANTIVNSSSYSVYSYSTSNVNATNNNLYGWTGTTTTTSYGVYYNSVNSGVISGNNILHSSYGVRTYSGAGIAIDTNTIVNSSYTQIYAQSTSNVNSTNNNLYGWIGTAATTSYGVYYSSVTPGVISDNFINASYSRGIYLSSSSNNNVTNNTLNNPNNNAYDTGTTNTWDLNFYSDYLGVDINGNLIGDTLLPYSIPGGGGRTDSQPRTATCVNNPGNAYTYASIQGAVNNASTGDTVAVCAGTFYETVTISPQITLQGAGRDKTILEGYGTGGTGITVNDDNFTVTGFGIQNYNIGVSIQANYVTITGNKFYENSNRQIYAYSSTGATITNNVIDAVPGASSSGVYFNDVDLSTISGNTITDNTWGAYLTSSGNNTIYNNYLNNTNNAYDNNNNYWNTTKQAGPNIVSGPYLGGNFWAVPNGTGFSETCTDADNDGICDSARNIGSGSSADKLPLAANQWILPPDTLPPLDENTTSGAGIVNLTDKGVPQDVIDQMGVTGYECIVTTNGTTPAVNLSVTIYTEAPPGVKDTASESGAASGFYYHISVNDSSWFDNVTVVQLRLYYDISNLNLPSGVSEDTLRPIRYTSGSWVKLDCSALGGCTATLADGTELYAAGVVNSSQSATPYIWANLSNFSIYGVGGAIVAAPASTGGGGVYNPEVVVLANSIDSALATDFFDFLRSQRITVTHASAADFPQYKESKRFIVILGGPDAYDGVGDIVNEALDETEQALSKTPGNRETYVKTNVWRTDMVGQIVWVIAGSDRELTLKEVSDSQADVAYEVKYPPTTG